LNRNDVDFAQSLSFRRNEMQTFESPLPAKGAVASRPSVNPLHVVCFSTYVAESTEQTNRHRDVRNFLLALRGEQIVGESKIPVGAEERTLTNENANDSIDWFGEMVTSYVETCHIQPPFSMVPVPTSKTTLESSAGPWTSLLAISIASNGLDGVSILDVLRWKQPLEPPSQRDQTVSELYENLAILQRLPERSPVILVDYLFTSSATLRACAARLRHHGADVLLGLCAGRTATKSSHDPFTVVTGGLHRYEPGH